MTAPTLRTGAAIAGFICVGLLAAGFLDPSPAWVRVSAALAGVVVAPAMLLCAPLGRVLGARRGVLSVLAPASVVAALAAHALVAGVFIVSHAPFSLYATCTIWALLLLYGFVATRRLHARGRNPRVEARAISARAVLSAAIVLATLIAFAAFVKPDYSGGEDAFDHMGHVRRVLTLDSMQPDGVLAMPSGDSQALPPDPRKGAFHDVVALVADLAGADPMVVWPLLRVLMFPLAVLAFAGFASVFAGGGTALAVCLGLFLLSYSGTAFQLVGVSAYGQNIAATWYWVVATLALVKAPPTRAHGMLLALLAAGGVFVHLGVALHMAVLGATLVVFAPALGLGRRDAIRMMLWLGLGAGVALLARIVFAGGVPAANEIHAHRQGVMTVAARWFVMSPMEILRQHGMVFLGGLCLVPLTAFAARRDARSRAALAASAIPLCIAFVPPLATVLFERGSYLAFRSLLNAPVVPLAVVTIAWLLQSVRARGVALRLAAALVLVGWGITFIGPSLRAFGADARRALRPAGEVARWGELDVAVAGLPAGATILSDPVTAYRLSAITSHRFVAVLHQHANPSDPYALERLVAVRDALSPYAIPQAAVEACRRFNVDFVVLSGAAREVLADYLTPGSPALFGAAWRRLHAMPNSFREYARGSDFVIFRFDGDAVAVNDGSGMPAPVAAGAGPPAACRVPVPRDLFEVTGFASNPAALAAGDSLDIVFGYRRDVLTAPVGGVVFHIRFDHEVVSSQRRFPGDKYVRRARERAAGTLYRFRSDLRPGHGVYEPDLWPMGTELVERFRVRIPPAAAPGVYRIEVRAAEQTLLPNFDVTDLLFNRDHYSGVPCGVVEVRGGDVQ